MEAMRTLALALCLLTSLAFALMPPHVTGVSPGSGQSLVEGRIVKFHGYSLSYGADVEVRDGSGQTVQVETFMWSRQECRGRPGPCAPSGGPEETGAEQTYCVLSVKLPAASSGARYELTLLGSSVTVLEQDGQWVTQP